MKCTVTNGINCIMNHIRSNHDSIGTVLQAGGGGGSSSTKCAVSPLSLE